jgi:hypothetical protein
VPAAATRQGDAFEKNLPSVLSRTTGTALSRIREGRDEVGPERDSGRRDEQAVELCDSIIDITSALFGVSSKEMRRTGRTGLDVARVRQVAMYVAHVVLRLTMKEVGVGFSRDRTTVLHACHLVEDLRDDLEFDRIVAMTERVVTVAFRPRLETR